MHKMELHTLRFTPTVGEHKEEFPYETPGSVRFNKVVIEIGKKLQLPLESLMVSPPGGSALTSSEYNLPVSDIIERYGKRFQILNKGVVG